MALRPREGPRRGSHVLVHRSYLEAPAADVWAWLARPGAIERLTPPWEPVEVLERGEIVEGARTVLRVGAGPLRRRWVAVHRDVEPGHRFSDVQLEGPFAAWVHTHTLEPAGPAACVLEDRVEYELPLGAAGRLLGSGAVRRRLRRLFAGREHRLRGDLAAHRRAGLRPLRVAVTGASGLIGSELVPFLTTAGHEVVRLVRRRAGPEEVEWDPERGRIDREALEGVNAVVHLAGAPVAAGRWTPARKREIRSSRVEGTRLVAETVAALSPRPAVLVSASAIGYYGDRGSEELDEASPPGHGFLPEVCQAWEDATAPAVQAGVRVVTPRFGVVFSPRGGALGKMLPVFRMGAGGRIGSGSAWLSWIGVDDAVGAILHAIAHGSLRGPVNVVAPEPVTNRELTRTLARVLRRPALAVVPPAALRLALGELAEEALLASARVLPGQLRASGYLFSDPELEPALRALLGKRLV